MKNPNTILVLGWKGKNVMEKNTKIKMWGILLVSCTLTIIMTIIAFKNTKGNYIDQATTQEYINNIEATHTANSTEVINTSEIKAFIKHYLDTYYKYQGNYKKQLHFVSGMLSDDVLYELLPEESTNKEKSIEEIKNRDYDEEVTQNVVSATYTNLQIYYEDFQSLDDIKLCIIYDLQIKASYGNTETREIIYLHLEKQADNYIITEMDKENFYG